MTEIVKLTKQQADELEEYRVGSGWESELDAFEDFMSDLTNDRLDSLKGSVADDRRAEIKLNMMRAYILNNYEVEPEFNVGDWVTWRNEKTGVVLETRNNDCLVDVKGGSTGVNQVIFNVNLRHATDEEIVEEKKRRWWNKHGRGVWELKQGDVLMGKHRSFYEVTGTPKSNGLDYYTGNDAHDFDIEECERGNWKIVCFKEDRKDL